MRVLILYTELAGYFLACLKHLLSRDSETKILLVHYPVNEEAPFEFNLSESLVNIEYSKELNNEILKQVSLFSPHVILCSGWSNPFYLRVVKKYKKTARSAVFIDNQWHGSLRQYILRLISPFWLTKLFDYAWVPGEPQRFYASKLGFNGKNILMGLYVGDTKLFKPVGQKKLATRGEFPKIMISVARYIVQKDLPTLWKAFIEANENTGNKWILNCYGFGELFDQRIENEYIHHMGFKQPYEMGNFLLESGVYILPSLFEPWGVAVHEMALSAMPMILSEKIGSVSMFLDSENGFSFKAGDVNDLRQKLEKIMVLPDEKLWAMAESSFNKGTKLQLDDWFDTIKRIAK